ncbi:MAG: PAS domain S-box protein [Burkholderiales bacterium]
MNSDTRRSLWVPALVLFIALAATAAGVWQLVRMADLEDASRFQRHVWGMQVAIEDQFDSYIGLLREGAALFTTDRNPSAAQFHNFVSRLNRKAEYPAPQNRRTPSSPDVRYPGMLGMGWLEVNGAAGPVQPGAGSPNVVLPNPNGVETRLGFVFLEPPEWRTQAMASFAMFTDPSSRAAMERARDTGKPAMSGKVTVIRDFWAKKRSGFHLFFPVYTGGGVPAAGVRRQALRGFVVASVQVDEMLSALQTEDSSRGIDMQVYDGTQTAPIALLYGSDTSHPTEDSGYRPRFSTTTMMDGPGRSWAMVFYTRPEFELASNRNKAPQVLLVGVLVSLLLAGINLVQRRASAALNASEERYRRLFEASPDGVFLFHAQTGRISSVNPSLAQLLGRTPQQLVGKYLWELGLFADEASGRAAFHELQDKDYHRFQDLSVVTPDGQRHDVEFTCNAYMANNMRFMQCNVRDVTARRRAESALRDSEERYRSLVEISPQGVWIIDRGGMPLFINRYWVDYSGVDVTRGRSGAWTEQVHPEDRPKMMEVWKRARVEDSLYECELRMRRASDGAYRWHLARGVPVHDAHGRIDKWLGVFIDINERKQAEQGRVQQLQREYALRTQAEAANRAKDDFLATLSHELRAPLNAILGWTQTLQHGDADRETVQRALMQIDASANAQAKLINDLLNVADIGSGRLRLDIQRVDLLALADAIVESLRPAITARDITLTTMIDPDAGQLSGDPARLQQIIWNLLSNAVKFTRHGGHITLSLALVGSQVEISVSDDGEGIGAEFLPYVFDPFRQADPSIKRRHGGLGLGLAIVRHLTELHGGTVSAQSAGENQGSRFLVRLPLRPPQPVVREAPAPPPPPAPSVPQRASPKRRLTGLRILSVDDDENTREMLQEALERAGAVVESAASAQEALDKLGSFAPHVLLSDIGLPDEDGYDLMRKVRALDTARGGSTPAVALTGYAREQDQKSAIAAGYQGFVAKPVNLEELSSAILAASAR